MELKQIKHSCYYFDGPVNIGYVQSGEKGLLIDAGIDKSTMKKIVKQLKEMRLPVTHLFITHAHSDHYGGAQYLQQQMKVYTIAPVLEEAIMRNPVLEPLYLFGGNDPLPELRNKFLEGKPILIDYVIQEGQHQMDGFSFDTYKMAGHSYYQLVLRINGVLYAGDTYFSKVQLDKHKIPFITDAQLTLESLTYVKTIDCDGAVPGHGIFEENFQTTVDDNLRYHQQILDWLEEKISLSTQAISHEDVIVAMCENFQVNPTQLSQWLLFRTAITAYLTGLIKQEKITYRIANGRWVFEKLSRS